MTVGANPSGQAIPEEQFRPGPAPETIETPTTPLQVAPEGAPAARPALSAEPEAVGPVQTSVFSAAGDNCPSCGAHMAADQRYCLHCGQRRGDPRLPFMDAVTFMDASRQPRGGAAAPPSPPRERRPRLSANASLIAGVGTLVLAIGVGVLIGRGGESSGSTANATPQVIKVEGGGGGATASSSEAGASSGTESSKGATATGGSGKGGKAAKTEAKAKAETGSSGTTKAAEEVLKPSGDVKMAPPKVQKGGSCEPGQAGCSNSGKFDGSFFE